MSSRAKLQRTRAACLLLLMLCQPAVLWADARSDGERGIAEYRKGNLIEGMALLQKAAVAGYPPAQTTLAFILDAAEDDAQALQWYQRAADSNDPQGLFGLGGMYAKGEGTAKNSHRAGQLIERAAQLGHLQAMRVYAHALEHGQLGFDPAPRAAADWYLQAARQGDSLSMRRLHQAYSLGQLGLPVDADRAGEWHNRLTDRE